MIDCLIGRGYGPAITYNDMSRERHFKIVVERCPKGNKSCNKCVYYRGINAFDETVTCNYPDKGLG